MSAESETLPSACPSYCSLNWLTKTPLHGNCGPASLYTVLAWGSSVAGFPHQGERHSKGEKAVPGIWD